MPGLLVPTLAMREQQANARRRAGLGALTLIADRRGVLVRVVKAAIENLAVNHRAIASFFVQ
jgi:hypothetical protein